ncbi:hypothetical protein JIN84_06660 [Luteolibacter yonseiensis]|uniref:Uncharacterized protein n=1 Tax=Luteolibacter yonseiensis TaxID=1144680 RepID=A0A934VAV6_9BACT|nr:hypothetical protein [Luteolibacter yonseiensis]MBK1815286.1 hypothetical protein [Luteolibacter yonseiensis]
MSRIVTHAISASLIGIGVVAWTFTGRALVEDPEVDAPLNPLGINGSPYGEVFAMAMQEPIDTYFHGAMDGGGRRHSTEAADKTVREPAATLESGWENLLTSLEDASEVRTNPKAASDAHKRYLRRQVEDKLRFAYQLDPAHYANYNSLHFFLTEPQLGTRPELTPSAAKLAEETIRYCLMQEHDPRPALTAAAAASNILELMFNDHRNPAPKFGTRQMRQYLQVLDHCIARHVSLSEEWDRTKNWELLSPQRVAECEERFQFILKFRETAGQIILRFEGEPDAPHL